MELPKNILPLVDGDWILYMACSAIEYRLVKEWKDSGEVGPEPTPSYEDTVTVLKNRIEEIKKTLHTTTEPIFFFTGANNFRKEVAVSKVYKGKREGQPKPFHYNNLKKFVETMYTTQEKDNLEADDLMSIWQTEWEANRPLNSEDQCCIVTVDKDLRQVNGWHYSPEGYNYGSFGPEYVTDENCWIKLSKNRKKIVGTGWKFFFSQLLTGDTVDDIPGLPHTGPVKALSILTPCATMAEAFDAVEWAYRGECWDPEAYLLEQGRLLWMVREIRDGKPVMWEVGDERV